MTTTSNPGRDLPPQCNCSVTATVIKLLLCQGLPKSAHFTPFQVQQNSLLNNTSFSLSCVCRDIKHPAELVEGTGLFLQPPFSPLVRIPWGSHPTVGLHQRQSHQHLQVHNSSDIRKVGGKEKKGGGNLCVPAECNNSFYRAQHHTHTSSEQAKIATSKIAWEDSKFL